MVLSTDVERMGAEDRMLHATASKDVKKPALKQVPVPVPMSIVRTDLSAFQEDCLRRLLTRYAGTDVIGGWHDGPASNGVKVIHGDIEGSAWHSLCATTRVPTSLEQALRVLQAPELLPKYDDMNKDLVIIEDLSEATKIRIVTCKSVLFTSARDFCVATTVHREPSGRVLIATRSVDHPASNRAGFVRAISHISGYVLTPDPADANACELSMVAHMDLGGSLPPMVIKYLGLSAPLKMVAKIRDLAVSTKF